MCMKGAIKKAAGGRRWRESEYEQHVESSLTLPGEGIFLFTVTPVEAPKWGLKPAFFDLFDGFVLCIPDLNSHLGKAFQSVQSESL